MTDEIVEQTKQSFDLKARLAGRGLREGQITLYLDETAGETLGDARDDRNNYNIITGRIQVGVLGEIDKLDPESKTYAADLKKLAKRRDELVAKLEATALVVKLRAVPPIIEKDCKRRAKSDLNIKGKVDESNAEAVNDSYFAHLLSELVVSITDVESGGEIGKQSAADLGVLKEQLPYDQWRRLDNKVAEIQFKDLVSDTIASDSDF